MTLVKREQASRLVSMGQQDDGKVGQTKVQACILVVKTQGQAMFFRCQPFHLKTPCRNILEE